jgi:phage shock protein PspC (stress-responsive transcriptional regulator)
MGNVPTVERYKPPVFDSPISKAFLKDKAMAVSNCMLSNSVGTVAGVGIGMYLGIQKKNLRPFVVAITIGAMADLFYGYTGNCRAMIDDYNVCKAMYAQSEEPEDPNAPSSK